MTTLNESTLSVVVGALGWDGTVAATIVNTAELLENPTALRALRRKL